MFGDKTWDDVRVAIHRRVARKFRMASVHDVEDVTSLAVMNLFSVWRNYSSTQRVTDPRALYAFAVAWGARRAQQYLVQEFDRKNREVSLQEPVGHYDDGPLELQDVIHCPLPTPEEVYLEAEEMGMAGDLIEQMSTSPVFTRWVAPLLVGESVREQARRECKPPMTIHDGRKRAVRECRRVVRSWGWVA